MTFSEGNTAKDKKAVGVLKQRNYCRHDRYCYFCQKLSLVSTSNRTDTDLVPKGHPDELFYIEVLYIFTHGQTHVRGLALTRAVVSRLRLICACP